MKKKSRFAQFFSCMPKKTSSSHRKHHHPSHVVSDADDFVSAFESPINFEEKRVMATLFPRDDSAKTTPSWTHVSSETFNVRAGPNYLSNGLKAPSESMLYVPLGFESFKDDLDIVGNISSKLQFPGCPQFYDPACGLPALLIVCAQLPLEGPSLWGRSAPDPGVSHVFYFQITNDACSWGLAHSRGEADYPPVVRVFKRLLLRGFSDKELSYKIIGIIKDFEKQNIPMAGMLKKYNGKPATVTASGKFNRGSFPYDFLEVDFDLRKWNLIARTAVPQLKDKAKELTIDFACLVEATEDEDLPERVLGAVRVQGLNWSKADHLE